MPLDAMAMPLADLELERALVALIFADNANIDAIGELQPEDLTDPVMSAALAGSLNMRAEKRPINLVTLKSRLEGIRIDENITALDVVRAISIGGSLPPIADIAVRLRSLAIKRRLSDYLRSVAGAIADESQPMPALIADALSQLNDHLAESNEKAKTAFDLEEGADEFLQWLQSNEDPVEITTGLRDLDEATGGWHRGQFIILAARPSMGKSAVALGSAIRTAMAGHGVLFFSLEMTKRQLVARALADMSYTGQHPIMYSRLKPVATDHEMRLLNQARDRFKNLPMVVETKNGLDVGQIMAQAKRVSEDFKAKGTPLALIVIDHMLKIRPSRRYAGQPVKELDEISEAMCVMAKSLNVAVLGLHQLNRGTESRDNPRPMMSDLRGSGSLEQDADVILFPYRPAYPIERQIQDDPEKQMESKAMLEAVENILEIQIAKQRQGPTTSLTFYVDMKSNVVRNNDFQRARR